MLLHRGQNGRVVPRPEPSLRAVGNRANELYLGYHFRHTLVRERQRTFTLIPVKSFIASQGEIPLCGILYPVEVVVGFSHELVVLLLSPHVSHTHSLGLLYDHPLFHFAASRSGSILRPLRPKLCGLQVVTLLIFAIAA